MERRLPAPAEVRETFCSLFKADPEQATAYLYDLGLSSGYIKAEEVAKNICWTSTSPYGAIECTINLSKPEKDPRAIAAAARPASEQPPAGEDEEPVRNTCEPSPRTVRLASARSVRMQPPHAPSAVPRCDLCWENEGFPGSPEHPAKPGLRIAAITLGGELWGLQYSPYAYFAEHCIALSEQHRPMKIDGACFERLLDFVDAFPFYFIGANADLPIVGGSILSHDHFQGGRHVFPLMKAPVERDVPLAGMAAVRCGIVRWPASVLRLSSNDRVALSQAARKILATWQGFSDEACGIEAYGTSDARGCSGPARHNTLNPIVRKEGATYLMDLVLRNNRTDADHPWGIFHPDESLHHIKKENIGLIEIMGLAILPPRLATELPLVQRELIDAAQRGLAAHDLEARLRIQSLTAPHAAWAADVYGRRAADLKDACSEGDRAAAPEGAWHGKSSSTDLRSVNRNSEQATALHPVIQQEVARVFIEILETTGVFKRTNEGEAGWNAFIEKLNQPIG